MFDRVLAFGRVFTSTAEKLLRNYDPNDPTKTKVTLAATLYQVEGPADESADNQPAFQSLGIVARPLPPGPIAGEPVGLREESYTEAIAARTGDGLVPFSFRDLRLNVKFPNPKEGTIALVGYGGAFLAFDYVEVQGLAEGAPDAARHANVATLYIPYEFDADGIPQKAHVLTFDPTSHGAESISLVHGDGAAIVMQPTELTLRSPSGANSVVLDDTDLRIYANVRVMGRMAVGIPTVGTPPTPAPVLIMGPGGPAPCIDLTVATPTP